MLRLLCWSVVYEGAGRLSWAWSENGGRAWRVGLLAGAPCEPEPRGVKVRVYTCTTDL